MQIFDPKEGFDIFSEMRLRDYLADKSSRLVSRLRSEDEEYILKVNEDEYIDHLTHEFTIDNLEIDFEQEFVSTAEEQIPKKYFPQEVHFFDGTGTHARPVIKYHLPFRGDRNLLSCLPDAYVVMTYRVTVEEGCICFKIPDFYGDAGRIRSRAEERTRLIQAQHATVAGQVNSYNSALRGEVANLFRGRKKRVLDQRSLLAELGPAIQTPSNAPETFAVPTVRPGRQPITKPVVQKTGSAPEPTLDSKTYNEILRTICDMGKEFERLPATYSEKDEEALRDHILWALTPRCEGGATGETFNKSGKTDILIRHQNTNLFVAECKFWAGAKEYLRAISQLLSYLTWRDSKAAVILFAQNKKFTPVLQTIQKRTEEHENYLGFLEKPEESWFNFRFHLPEDEGREVSVAVIAFHLPKSA